MEDYYRNFLNGNKFIALQITQSPLAGSDLS